MYPVDVLSVSGPLRLTTWSQKSPGADDAANPSRIGFYQGSCVEKMFEGTIFKVANANVIFYILDKLIPSFCIMYLHYHTFIGHSLPS